MSIVNDGMIVNMQLGAWTGHRLDREASRKVTEEAGAEADAARVNKHLVPKEAMKPIISASNALRAHFYDRTLPWKDNGDRLLTRKMYMRFIEEHGKLKADFDRAVEDFLSDSYPKARDQAQFRMGDLFKSDDYPSVSDLRRRFYVNLDIDAVTEAGDFRVQMEDHHLDAIRHQMEQAMRERMGRAMSDVWTRLVNTVGHFASKMAGDEVFRDSTVKNLEELVEMLPALNVLEDPELERVRQELLTHVVGYEPKELRTDKGARYVAATEAQRIMDEMKGFMNAFGVAA